MAMQSARGERMVVSVLLVMVLGCGAALAAPLAEINSTFIATPPTIDGEHGPGEWDDATVFELNVPLLALAELGQLAQGGEWPDGLEAVLAVANDAENLYIALELRGQDYDATIDMAMGVLNTDAFSVELDSDWDAMPSIGDDQKTLLAVSDGTYLDQHRVSVGGGDEHEDDAQAHGEARITHSTRAGDGDYIIEMRIPLSSGDDQDISLEAGDTVGVTIIFVDGFDVAALENLRLGLIAGDLTGALTGGSPFAMLALATE